MVLEWTGKSMCGGASFRVDPKVGRQTLKNGPESGEQASGEAEGGGDFLTDKHFSSKYFKA